MFGFGKKKSEKIASNLAQNTAEVVGVIHSQEEFDKFMLEYPKKLASEGYTELGGNVKFDKIVGELLYPEFSKLDITIGQGEIYEYTHAPYKLLVSRGELGVMWGFIKK